MRYGSRMPAGKTALPESVGAALAAAADPARAPGMQAYMKSAMPYLGVSAVPLRRVCRAVFAELSWPGPEAWQADVLAIWRGARFREERYAAIELTGVRAARPFQTLAALPLYEEMIVAGAWWDYVDNIVGQRFWTILQNEGAPMKRAMLGWSTDADMWKRRSAILCQLKGKAETDLELLSRVYRTVDRFDRVLPAQGDRVGVAAVCVDRPRGGAAVCHGARRSAERAQPTGSVEEYRAKLTFHIASN